MKGFYEGRARLANVHEKPATKKSRNLGDFWNAGFILQHCRLKSAFRGEFAFSPIGDVFCHIAKDSGR